MTSCATNVSVSRSDWWGGRPGGDRAVCIYRTASRGMHLRGARMLAGNQENRAAVAERLRSVRVILGGIPSADAELNNRFSGTQR
jgi:hypothetical protein